MNSLAGIDMGRILLDLSNEVIKQLDDLEVQRNLPRADLLREAVDQYLINQSQTARTSVPGIWQGCEEDGVEYQRKLREEWQWEKMMSIRLLTTCALFMPDAA